MKRFISIALVAILLLASIQIPVLAESRDYSVKGSYVLRITVPKNRTYIYLYDKPSSTKGKNLGKIENGDSVYAYYKVKGIGSSSYWVYCKCRGKKGYIRTNNISR